MSSHATPAMKPEARGTLTIRDGGAFATLQDFGRSGWQRAGISAAGAMDATSMRLANRLVGNDAGVAIIEAAMTGLAFSADVPLRLALTGAEGPFSIAGTPAAPWRAHDVPAGAEVRIGAARQGLRFCLAIAGGFALAPVMGSLSTHTRSHLGGFHGRALQAGDRLPLAASPINGPCLTLPPRDRPDFSGPIRVVLGPQDDAFTDAGIETFLTTPWRLSVRADRMGCELEGPAIAHRAGFNIVSDGIMNGSVQVPGHGRPVMLLADRQPTGGYPKIATVITPDLSKLAQRRPGDEIRFQVLSAAEAAIAARDHVRRLAAMEAAMLPAGALDLTSEFLLRQNLAGMTTDALADPFAALSLFSGPGSASS